VKIEECEYTAGFPEFWPKVIDEYKKFFEVGNRLDVALVSVTDAAHPALSPCQKTILNLSILAGVAMTEIVTLAMNGMGPGAMKVTRTLLETSINTEYLRQIPSEFDDYKEWFWIEKYKELAHMRENLPEILKNYPPERAQEVERNRNRVLPRFEKTRRDGTKELRGSWCSKNLADRANITGHQHVYQQANRDASGFIHGTMSALLRHDNDEDINRIGVPPSIDWTRQALTTSHVCMIKVVETASLALNAPCSPTVIELFKDFNYAWEKPV
jgi:hypothetical protein